MLPHRDKIRSCYHIGVSAHNQANFEKVTRDLKTVKNVIRRIIQCEFIWNDRYKSDFNQEYYQAQGAVTPLLTGSINQAEKDPGDFNR